MRTSISSNSSGVRALRVSEVNCSCSSMRSTASGLTTDLTASRLTTSASSSLLSDWYCFEAPVFGLSHSYMYTATKSNKTVEANGDGISVWTVWTLMEPDSILPITSLKCSKSSASFRQSRMVSMTMGKSSTLRTIWSKSPARSRWSQSGVRFPMRVFGSSRARAAF